MKNERGETVLTMQAKSLPEAKERLFDEYNTNYHIENYRNIPKRSFFGFHKDYVEVYYTLKSGMKNIPSQVQNYSDSYAPNVGLDNPIYSSFAEELKNKSEQFKQSQQNLLKENSASLPNAQINAQIGILTKKIDSLAETVADSSRRNSVEIPESILRIQELLSQNDFSFSYIQDIVAKIKSTFTFESLDDFELVERKVVDWIGESIEIKKQKVQRKPHVFIIVGPTGVGKTTTLVKLATHVIKKNSVNGERPSFCFITTDTMRVGALEQIQRFGELMETKVLKAQKKEDLMQLYEANKDSSEYIFIDTGGYSPNDSSHIAEMKNVLSVHGINPDVYLAVTASTKASDLLNIMKNYEPFGYKSVIVTKCDESIRLGNVISALYENHKSISFVTTGQNMINTLFTANIVDFLNKLDGFKIDRIHIMDKFDIENEETIN